MQSGRVSCVVMGDGSLLTQCSDHLLSRDFTISAIVTGNKAIADWATARGLRVLDSTAIIRDGLPELEFDWFFGIANLRLLPKAVWQAARRGAANFHDGPLPRHAGLNAPAWAILAGDSEFGVTWHALSEGIDEGDIYAQELFAIDADETSLTLNLKCFEAGLASFGRLIADISAGTLIGAAQDLSARSYHARRERPQAGATLNFAASSAEIDRLARAMKFGDQYFNPLSLPKLLTSVGAFNVGTVEVGPTSGDTGSKPAGTVLNVTGGSAEIAAADGVIRVSDLSDESGATVAVADVVRTGDVLPALSDAERDRLDVLVGDVSAHEPYFQDKLQRFVDLELPGLIDGDLNAARWQDLKLTLPASVTGERAVAALIAGLARLTGRDRVDAFFANDELKARAPGYVAASVPLSVAIDAAATVASLSDAVSAQLADLQRRVGYAADLAKRVPGLAPLRSSVAIKLLADTASAAAARGSVVTFIVPTTGSEVRVLFDANRMTGAAAQEAVRRLTLAANGFADASMPIAKLPLLTQDEIEDLIHTRNATARDYDRDSTVHALVAKQAAATPDAIAIVCGNDSLTYRELEQRADRVAAHLVSLGVGPDVLVGLNLRRSCDLVVGALGILKAGGAYVPLDPTYPADRIAYMIEDGGLQTILVESSAPRTSRPGVRHVTIAGALANVAEAPAATAQSASNSLAYVIYTSGSTGRPKGVMVEHRNVVNFFVGMDERIQRPSNGQGVWLAVTSLSFDISVLELFWTLARGFKVIVQAGGRPQTHGSAAAVTKRGSGNMEFGLFYWGDDDQPGARKYELLLEGARFADTHGFTSVWTPERHFHAFGGPYPNPAVTGAAVAAVTKNLSVRAGSCVLPLHHPARVAEEWSIIDNLSNGRAALAFASGWMPEDFILRPENAPPANKAALFRDIEVVRKLWRGETVPFEGAGGKSISVTTLPRPVQGELPVWVTTAGNPDTFREAARHGANILTHLLGQTVEEVAEKVAAYRDELRLNGYDPDQFKVTMMLHTLVGHDREVVREQARGPMKRYLRSAAALIKQYAWAFPAFKRPVNSSGPGDIDLRSLQDDEMDAVLEFAFLRYFDDSGLFGTIDDAVARVAQLTAIGVDEIACLIDFGVPSELALSALQPLSEVVARTTKVPNLEPVVEAPIAAADSVGELIRLHQVTHMQCTPSMAAMLLDNDDDRAALRGLSHLYIGGEALSGTLVQALSTASDATIENMYGPTETTIWSSTASVRGTASKVPLGTPIANTQLYVLDSHLLPVPVGTEAELFIGGDGVVRGYHQRPELTAERFLDNPFVPGGRMYRTGDIARIEADGALTFIGRSDHQVKVRGHRIELGEIEECLNKHPDVSQAVVIVREDTVGDARIVAYVRFKGAVLADDDLRAHARKSLPDFMLPAHFVALETFPLTPNLKVDRKALPKPGQVAAAAEITYTAPASDIEMRIADVYKRVLGVERVGLTDNFFSLGGHSLLAVQAHREIKSQITPKLSITDLYRFPTIAGLVGHLRDLDGVNKHLDKIAARASGRRAAMASRRASP